MQKIIDQYEDYMIQIESLYGECEVPARIQAVYLLSSMIAMGSLKNFYGRYGWVMIDAKLVNEGKSELGLEPITQFEYDTCRLWNKFLSDLESHSDQRRPPYFTTNNKN